MSSPSNTPRPKSLAVMFLLGAFLTGGAVGFAADRAMGRGMPEQVAADRDVRDDLAKELSLTAEQRSVVDSILDWRRERYRVLMTEVRPVLDSARDSARVLIAGALNPAQTTAFWALIERNRLAADSVARARETNK